MTKFLWVIYRHRVSKWGLSSWWTYLCTPRRDSTIPWYTVIRCRLACHHGRGAGPIFVNMGRNVLCRKCRDHLGEE